MTKVNITKESIEELLNKKALRLQKERTRTNRNKLAKRRKKQKLTRQLKSKGKLNRKTSSN